jgi:hypothetical protein
MQTIITNLLKKLSDKGFSNEQLGLYLQGLFDGMKLICTQVKGNKHIIKEHETDPLFVHNWNYIVEQLVDIVEETIKDAYDSIPKDKENEPRGQG